MFAAQMLAPRQLLALQQALDDNMYMYVCRAPLFPPEHELYSNVVVREDAECTTVIEPSSVLLGQVRIPKDLLCVWPQESAGNNSCHA